jgi:hypothetical protein
MEPITRRSFIVSSSAGAAGAAATGLLGGAVLVQSTAPEARLRPDELDGLSHPVLLQIRDAAAGEVELLVGDREVVFTDRALVAKVLRAAR